MRMGSVAATLLSIGVTAACIQTASGQNFPAKPIRLVTSEAGGWNDLTARLISQGLSSSLGQQVVVENLGGSVIIPTQVVTKASPDGYTLLLYSSVVWLLPYLQNNVPYDPVKDLVPVVLSAESPNVLVVHPSLPVASVKDLIALAKAKPGQLNYSSGPSGNSTHLAAEMFKSMTGVDMVQIAYKGGGPAIIGLIGGQVQLSFASAGSIAAHLKSGRLKALAVTNAEPTPLFPGLPAISATVPGYEASSINGIFAPVKTPEALISRLNQAITTVLAKADVKERLLAAGIEAAGGPPKQLATTMKLDMTKWAKVIKDAGIRAD